MHPPNENGRATWTRPVFDYGAPCPALHVNITHDPITGDVRYIARVHGIVHAGVADSTGASDAHAYIHPLHL